MDKLKFYIIYFLILMYMVLYKLIFASYNELFQYIINPLIWILITVFSCILLYHDKKTYFPFKISVTYRCIISALLYIIFFYTLGKITGFSKNPYSLTYSGVIINFFSLLLIVGLKEIIRSILVNNVTDYHKVYIYLVFILFIFIDFDVMALTKMSLKASSIIEFLISDLLTNIINTLFCLYLVKKSGFLASLSYKLITYLPILIIPVVPKYPWIITVLFNIVFPIATFITIERLLREKNRFVPKDDKDIIQPKYWITTFIISGLIIVFSLGGFGVKPIVIITGSMQPTIKEGDLLVIKECDIKDITIGNIIQYQLNDYTVVHRVIKIYQERNAIKLITKGDNNNNEDRYPVTKDNLVGCLKYRLPYLGYPTYLIGTMLNKEEVKVETGG